MPDTRLVNAEAAGMDWWVDGWWLYRRLSAGTREQRVELERAASVQARIAHAAYEHVHRVVEAGGGAALEALQVLLRSAPDSDSVSAVGVGPLEDLVHQHGEVLVEGLVRLARQDPAFGAGLSAVWLETGRLPPEVEHRLGPWVQLA